MTTKTSSLNPELHCVNKILMYLCLIAGTGMALMGLPLMVVFPLGTLLGLYLLVKSGTGWNDA